MDAEASAAPSERCGRCLSSMREGYIELLLRACGAS
jgi:hypothetical protein